jgi:DNA-binding response OmpR family regulator
MPTILVIEDEPQMRRNILTILEMEGYVAHGAENGRLGLELVQRERPDLVLCDIMMPELDGYGVLQALRADAATSNLPFVFLTAKGEKAELRTGMNLGADDYLTKPVVVEDLLAAVRVRLRPRV